MKTVVILQSNYIPWKGYFDLIHDADLFIFYDDVQFTSRDWRTRNKIKTSKGTEWITVPAGAERSRLIHEVDIKDAAWQAKHWKSIRHNYANCPYFSNYKDFFDEFYLVRQWGNLSEMNQYLIQTISTDYLGISTEFVDSRKYNASGQKLERILELVTIAGADRYISGPAAKDYIDPLRFDAVGVEVIWKNYSGYPEYPQRHPPFEHSVTILDLLFNVGPDAPWYIWGWREGGSKPS
ncbi:MAG: WbqC family protein [Gammaproteobacteria bacterium]|nr:MAG: WbqC family protein [Gammaproteobacteria bacterium]